VSTFIPTRTGPALALLGLFCVAAVALLAVIAVRQAASGPGRLVVVPGRTDPASDLRGLVVGGSATLQAVPDVADVRATLAVEAASAVEATRQVSQIQSAAAAALEAAGVAPGDLSLSSLGLEPVLHPKTGAIVRYRAAIDVTAVTRDFDQLAPLLEVLGGQGATHVATTFRVSDLPALKARVRREAAAAAQAKARELADVLGIELGAVRSVSESPGDGWSWNGSYANAVVTEQAPGATHGNLQPITLTINVAYDLG